MADDRRPTRPRRALGADEPTTGGPRPPAPSGPGLGGRFTEDEARPIFREAAHDADAATVRTPADAEAGNPPAAGATRRTGTGEGPEAAGSAAGQAPARRLTFTPRARPADEDATTLLPRTTGREGARALVVDADLEDLEERPRRLGHRARLALLVSAVAAVVVVGLAIGYAVVGVRDQPGAGVDPGPGVVSTSGATPTATVLLDDASMLTPQGARSIDAKQTFTAGATVRGPVPDGSGPACLGSDPLEGAPTPQQTITRTLTGSGSNAPTAVHVAQGYASPEDATQAFAVTARALGTCAVTGDWLFRGRDVQGIGDESTAVAVTSVADGRRTQHWVVLSRTGRALDVVDATTAAAAGLDPTGVARALSSAVAVQCGPAGGTCPTAVVTKDAAPPAGGDEPAFLTTGDLPPVGSTTAPWVGTPVEPPSADFTGSQCESVNWATTAATTKSSRVYLLQDVPGIFGLNEIVLTSKDPATAARLVEKVRADWASCKERKLTATVAAPARVAGVGAGGAPIAGWTTQVEQKAGSSTTLFRVGIAASGDTVAFVFLNPQRGLDVAPSDWGTVAVRAVQRATQS